MQLDLSQGRAPLRRNFGRIKNPAEIPNLIELQKRSYEKFLQFDVSPEKRDNQGLQAVFKSIFPIEDFNKTASLEFDHYTFERPKYDQDECRARGMTYEAPLKITVRLVVYDIEEGTENRSIRDIKEQEVWLGAIPLMTDNASFIINGVERVIVSQLHRSPGVIFNHDSGKSHSSGKLLYSARIIPHRGSWLDFEFDHRDILYARIDRRRKFPASIVLKALGMSTEELLNYYYKIENIIVNKDGTFEKEINPEVLLNQRAAENIIHPKTGDVIVKKDAPIRRAEVRKISEAGLKVVPIREEHALGRVLSQDLVNPKTGEVLAEVNSEITSSVLGMCQEHGIKKIPVIFTDNLTAGAYLRETLLMDGVRTQDQALIEVFKRMRPGDPPTLEAAKQLFEFMFFRTERYDLSRVGRLKLNYRFPHLKVPIETTWLTKEDILETVKYLINLNNGQGTIDDIDHLGNRRIRAVGELLENQYRVGLVRMERAIKERLSIQDIESLMPHDLINQKPVSSVVKEFFGSSQLSQFMDQNNPLGEITHKRRLSALGPGGLTRERAGFDVRDVHPTHYGRICPIETPEGPNIGLISSLATFARVNEYGFIETPYYMVSDSELKPQVKYLSAIEEESKVISSASPEVLESKKFLEGKFYDARREGDYSLVQSGDINAMDVSPSQLVSIATGLIPFLENDDTSRALMGANMQRQAVPLIRAKAPLLGTGVEPLVARDSGALVIAKHSGVVQAVEGSRIVIRRDDHGPAESAVDIYHLIKYRRSNQGTCITQRPLVHVGDVIKAGDLLADGPSTAYGELALGQNVLVAFMPWHGYNFEDSILINERIIRDDTFTSIHIEELECAARDTKLGKEEITRDIPNVSEEALRYLDDSGIITLGAEVRPGDVIVGKVTPKGETQLSPEEKLLRAIFGEKAGDVKDTSLRCPTGISGTVVDVQVFTREGTEEDSRSRQIRSEQLAKIRRDEQTEMDCIKESAIKNLAKILSGASTTGKLLSEDGTQELLPKDAALNEEVLRSLPFEMINFVPLKSELEKKVDEIVNQAKNKLQLIRAVYKEKADRLKKGDELAPGMIKMVRVYIAIKRRLSVGDKMAGRHGNKGIISKIVPEEDMPFTADGRTVDFVLNPLGVPSRMNIGQILEVMLGWAARGVGDYLGELLNRQMDDQIRQVLLKVYDGQDVADFVKAASSAELRRIAEALKGGLLLSTPVFDGAHEPDIQKLLSVAELPGRGQTTLFDGKTGEPFMENVTIGIMYMLKLHHLVDEKIHARSIGPYSLVTQQPLGGKAQFGGQRLGEMEVWALEGYGCAYGLQEFLTVKSDDVPGRNRMYEAIVKGENVLEPGVPESFNVLVKELQGLTLDMELVEDQSRADS